MQKHHRLVEQDWRSYGPKGSFRKLVARGGLLSMQARCTYVKEIAQALGISLRS